MLYKENTGFAAPVVILVDAVDLEPERLVEGNRALVHRRGDRAHDGARRDRLEEALVQGAAEPGAARSRVDADEMDVRLVGVGLRSKPAEKSREILVVLRDE